MTLKASNLKISILYICTLFKEEQMWAQHFVYVNKTLKKQSNYSNNNT